MKINILGVDIENSLTIDTVLEKIEAAIESKQKLFITTVNPEIVMAAKKDNEFKEILNKADLSLPDGVGLRYAAFFRGKSLKQTIPGSSLTEEICRAANEKSYKIFLLGGDPRVAELAAIKLKKRLNNIQIVGAEEGMSRKNFSYCDQKLIKKINQVRPDILFVSFGAPKQEKWIYYNLPKLNSVKIAVGVGGTFDFLAGIIKRAPLVFRAAGFEWLYRLIKQPKRIKRILTAVILFPLAVVFKK